MTSAGTSTTGVPVDLGDPCGGGMGEPEFSYIWIANSSQGTISKIDTQTLQEKGRYIVRPDSAGSPSRTSVNLTGDVVVANRSGGMAKVYARVDDCVESNGMPGIQTSMDGNALPWGVEECVAWYTPMNYVSQRPAAWTQGTFNKDTCGWENQKVWTSGCSDGQFQGVDILRLNGQTGAIEDKINVPSITPGYYGMYGAAVDKSGNMWSSQLGQGQLLFVDGQTLQYKTWPMVAGGYGMTVGASGYVWTCSSNASRFDPMTEQWITMTVGGSGGCMEDDNGTLYMSAGAGGMVAIDVETLQVKATYPLPEYVHGISIDYYGYVWGVSIGANAYRLDVQNPGAFQTFSNLVGAYTYSDMTGVALSNVSPQ
jgi:streptogramin lyase